MRESDTKMTSFKIIKCVAIGAGSGGGAGKEKLCDYCSLAEGRRICVAPPSMPSYGDEGARRPCRISGEAPASSPSSVAPPVRAHCPVLRVLGADPGSWSTSP